jgi:hypothetical protein
LAACSLRGFELIAHGEHQQAVRHHLGRLCLRVGEGAQHIDAIARCDQPAEARGACRQGDRAHAFWHEIRELPRITPHAREVGPKHGFVRASWDGKPGTDQALELGCFDMSRVSVRLGDLTRSEHVAIERRARRHVG